MTVLLGVVGSTAYGLATESSDEDLLGVYVADAREVCGLRGPSALTKSRVTHEPDVTLHELYKFATLALKCNPTVSELLWLDGYKVLTDEGRALIGIREAFLSTGYVRSAYGGYALQQSRKLLARHDAAEGTAANLPTRTAKHARHCLRLLRQARGLLATGYLTVDMTPQRDELFAAGELATRDVRAFAELFEREMAVLDTIGSVLPDRPDADRVEALLIELRMASLGPATTPR